MPDKEIYMGEFAPKDFAAYQLWRQGWADLRCGIRVTNSAAAVLPPEDDRLTSSFGGPVTIEA